MAAPVSGSTVVRPYGRARRRPSFAEHKPGTDVGALGPMAHAVSPPTFLVMVRLINIDNGGTLTDVCVVDGAEVRYTKTLTTPFDLSRCLFDGLAKASALVY